MYGRKFEQKDSVWGIFFSKTGEKEKEGSKNKLACHKEWH